MLKTRFALAASIATLALAGCGSSTSSTASTNNAGSSGSPTASDVSGAPSGTTPGGGAGGPGGTRPQMQPVTGTAATKAKAAAVAKYPGTAGDVMKIGTGYVVQVTTSSGVKMVAVSSDFTVTGLQQRPAGGPPSGGVPSGVAPKSGAPTATTPAGTAAS